MKLFKTVDDKLADIGFRKIKEDQYGVRYKRKDDEHSFVQTVDIFHKASGRHLLQSYDDELTDQNMIGNTCVGITGYEMNLFLKKMKKIGLYPNKQRNVRTWLSKQQLHRMC